MKTRLFSFVSVVCLLLCLQAQGQTYYNYALGHASLTEFSSHSNIRSIDGQSAIAYYEGNNGTEPTLVYLDINSINNVNGVKLKEEYDLMDMKIVNGEVFFCGRNKRNGCGFIGHVKVSDVAGQVVNSVDYYDLMGLIGSTIMWNLEAYDDGTGTIRVVSLGNITYEGEDLNNVFGPCPLYAICQGSFFVECIYSGTLQLVGSKIVGDKNRFEHADDVVVTDNWLAIITTYPDASAIAIHRCAKNNVLGTFDNYYYYQVYPLEGGSHCCKMKGDTIADATLCSLPYGSYYESHMRTFDLNTMTMTRAQWFPLLEKAEPQEVVYLSEYATLVTLQYHMYPSTALRHTFISWKPYNTTPYYAKLTYDSNAKEFQHFDRLTTKHIAATGGNYWIMKDIIHDLPAPRCYTVDNQNVETLQISYPQATSYAFPPLSIYIYPNNGNDRMTEPMTGRCWDL